MYSRKAGKPPLFNQMHVMNTTHSFQLSQVILVRSTTVWLTGACLFLSLLLPCRAQTNSRDLADQVKKRWRTHNESPSGYLINGEAIKHQIRGLLKSLSHLSMVDPATYSRLQGDLHAYVHQLEEEQVDYGDPDTYQGVQLRLIRFGDQIKAALVEGRRLAHEDGSRPDTLQHVPRGVKVSVRPYALLFKKPDYQSAWRHIISPNETVTVLKDTGTYCLVKCAVYKGYLSKAMILAYNP